MLKYALRPLEDPEIPASIANLTKIVTLVENIAISIFGLLTVAAVVLAIFLAYKFFTADSEDKRKNAKKQLIYAIIGIIVLVVLIALTPSITTMLENAVSGKKAE